MKPEQEQAWSSMNGNEQLEYLSLEQLDSVEPPPKKGVGLGPTLRLLRRNIFLIGLITTAVTGATYALTWDDPSYYGGQFDLLVEPVTAEARLTEPSALSRGENSPAGGLDYSSLIEVLTSTSVLERILAQINTQYPEVTYSRLNNRLDVERVGQDSFNETKLVRVTYEAVDQQEVLFVLEELKKGYLQFGLEDRKKHIGRGVAFIEEQLPNLKQQVSALESQLQTLQQQSRISDPDSEGESLARRAQELETQKLEAKRDLESQRQLYTNLQNQLGLAPTEALAASSLTEDANIQKLRGDLQQVENDIATSPLLPEHPQMQDLVEQRENLQALLNQQTSQVVGKKITGSNAQVPQLNSIQTTLSQQLIDTLNQIQVLEIRSQAATQAAAEIDNELKQFPAIKLKYNGLERNLELATKQLEERLLQYETLKVEAAQKDIPWQIPSEPDLLRDRNGKPILSETDRNKKLALGVLGGLALGIGAALLREKQQDVFHNTDDLQENASVSMLGALPFNDAALELESTGVEVYEGGKVRSGPVLEFDRSAENLYTKIRFLSVPPIRSLVVSSVAPQDGKTTVSIHLALAAAGMGQRVLLVDTNFSLPQLHAQFEVPNFEGVSDILSGNLDPNQVIQRSPYHANLSLLTVGQMVAQASQMLAGQPMHYLMTQLNDLFDFVVYDASHLEGNSDANFVAANTNGLLLVVGIGKTRQSQVIKTLDSLRAKRLRVLGIVANFSGMAAAVSSEESLMDYDAAANLDELEDEFEIFRVGTRQ